MTLDSYTSSHTPIVPNILLEADRGGDSEECWICLSNEGTLARPCECPRVCHRECIATWQLTNYGRREENYCRFCNKKLPALWKADPLQDAAADELRVAPVMAVRYNGPDGTREFRLRVQPGPEGLATFKRHLKELLGFDVGPEFDVTFECQMPATGSTLTLSGLNAYGAATHCAALLAATKSDATAVEGPSTPLVPHPAVTSPASAASPTPPHGSASPPPVVVPQSPALLPITTQPTPHLPTESYTRRHCQTGYLSVAGGPTGTGSQHSVSSALRSSQSLSSYGCSTSPLLSSSPADRPSGSRPRPTVPCSATAGGRQAARRASGTLLTAGGLEYDSQDEQDPLEDFMLNAGRRGVIRDEAAMLPFKPVSISAAAEFEACAVDSQSHKGELGAGNGGRVAAANTRNTLPDYVLGHMLSESSAQFAASATAIGAGSGCTAPGSNSHRAIDPERRMGPSAISASIPAGNGSAPPQVISSARSSNEGARDTGINTYGRTLGDSLGGDLSPQIQSGRKRSGQGGGVQRDRLAASRTYLPHALRNTAGRTFNSMMRALQHVTLKPTAQARPEGAR